MVLYMSMTSNKDLSDKLIRQYRKKCTNYISGKGKVLPKWAKFPNLDRAWIWEKKYEGLDDKLKRRLYPFRPDTPVESMFRILVVQRLACLLAGDDKSYEYIRAIEEWIRQLLISNDAERLRDKLGVTILI